MTMGGGDEGIHRLFRRVEGARDPDDALAGGAAAGKAVAVGDQPVPDRLGQADENEVDLGGAPEPNAGNLRQPLAPTARADEGDHEVAGLFEVDKEDGITYYATIRNSKNQLSLESTPAGDWIVTKK